MQRQALNEEGEFITAGSLMLEPGPDDTPPPPNIPFWLHFGIHSGICWLLFSREGNTKLAPWRCVINPLQNNHFIPIKDVTETGILLFSLPSFPSPSLASWESHFPRVSPYVYIGMWCFLRAFLRGWLFPSARLFLGEVWGWEPGT